MEVPIGITLLLIFLLLLTLGLIAACIYRMYYRVVYIEHEVGDQNPEQGNLELTET